MEVMMASHSDQQKDATDLGVVGLTFGLVGALVVILLVAWLIGLI